MYTVGLRDHFMIAHRLQGKTFGPAQQLHGATYVVDLELRRPELDSDAVVVDIGKASACLRAVLSELNYRNLDEVPEFAGQNTTTEFLARMIFVRLARQIADGKLGPNAAGLTWMCVTLHESHVAWASYQGTLP
jgi:6-pyruvoyl-tetrahydropterin synthase